LELVIVLSLTAVVLPTAYAMVSAAQNAEAITTNRFTALGSAQVIMDRISKDIRAGVGVLDTTLTPQPTMPQVFLSAGPRDLVFYAGLSDPNGPSKLHLYTPAVANTSYDSFNEDLEAANSGGATPNFTYPTTWGARIQGRYVSPVGVVFSYYDASGGRLDDGVNALAAAQLLNVDAVSINLVTTTNPTKTATAPLTVLSVLVHVRNADYNPNGT
jgi:hypothetical protein